MRATGPRVFTSLAAGAAFLASGAAILLIASPGRAAETTGTVTIGLFVPLEGEGAPAGLEARRGAEIAVTRANRERRAAEPAVRVVTASSARTWGDGASGLARLIYDEGAVAVVGALDGRAAHVAEQVITRARGRAVFVTPWAAEPTLTRLRIPWFFSVAPDDVRQAAALVEEIFRRRGSERALVWVEDSYDARAVTTAFVEAAPRGAVTLFASGTDGRAALAAGLEDGGAGVLVLFADPRRAADLAEWLRRRGNPPALFGPLALTLPRNAAIGGALEGAMVVAPAGNGTAGALEFGRDFRKAYGSDPSPLAAYAHDAVAVVVKALRSRARPAAGAAPLETVLAATSLDGATGTVRFDARRGRDGAPVLAFLTRDGLAPSATAASCRPERMEVP